MKKPISHLPKAIKIIHVTNTITSRPLPKEDVAL